MEPYFQNIYCYKNYILNIVYKTTKTVSWKKYSEEQ